MSNPHDSTTTPTASTPPAQPVTDRRHNARRFPLTDTPAALILTLVALGVPRTILADLAIVPPESGPLYYVLALTPYAAWLAVALMRPSRRPIADFFIVGVLCGLSLVVIHQALWNAGPSLGHNPPSSASDFADRFTVGWRDLALRAYTSGIALIIGIGSGLVTGIVGLASNAWRAKRSRTSTA